MPARMRMSGMVRHTEEVPVKVRTVALSSGAFVDGLDI